MSELIASIIYTIIFSFIIIYIIRLQDEIDKLKRENNELKHKI